MSLKKEAFMKLAQQLLADAELAEIQKQAFTPMGPTGTQDPAVAPQGAPMDPNMAPPMDPAMMGGMPPAPMPMDPAMGGMPMDPAMGGMPPAPVAPAQPSPATMQEMLAQGEDGVGATGKKLSVDDKLTMMSQVLENLTSSVSEINNTLQALMAPPMPGDPMVGAPMDPAMMDPAMGGMPPMDPAMMAPPMDPAMAGGVPPMDPAMMAPPMPMDPGMAPPKMAAVKKSLASSLIDLLVTDDR